MISYLLVGSCLWLAMLAFWKKEAMLGFAIIGACLTLYWLLIHGPGADWTHWPPD